MGSGRHFLRDPLLHFLIAGTALFFIGWKLQPPEPAADTIVIDRANLLQFIQYRLRAFDTETAEAMLDSMDSERRDALVRDLIEEEVLYREAQALGLDADDYVIKQRMIQKVGFFTESTLGGVDLNDAEIAAYYRENNGDYRIPAAATFTHVFFSHDNHPPADAARLAAAEASALNAAGAPMEAAMGRGERFIFHQNYAERTRDYVASQFGDAATLEIFDSAAPLNTWRAPVVSEYGAHAVFVRDVTPARTPALEEIRDTVAEDALREKKRLLIREAIDATIADYDVRIDLGEPALTVPAPPDGVGE